MTAADVVADPLPQLPAGSFRRVLSVVAHPDDVEYGASAAVASWTSRGVDVAYLLLTRGEAGMDSLEPAEAARVRTREQLASSEVVGVSDVTFLDYPDGVLEYGLPLRRDIARVIRRYRPDAVLAGSWELEFVAGLNQADHRVAGLATLDAIRDAGNRWVFPELLDEGLPPHSVRWLLVHGDPRPTHGVDLEPADLERGIASLEAHSDYLAGVAGHPAPRHLITGITAAGGRVRGVEHAVVLRVWDFASPAGPGERDDADR